MPNYEKEISEFVEELLSQAPALVTHEELKDYKAKASALLRRVELETLEDLQNRYYELWKFDAPRVNLRDLLKARVFELKALTRGGSDAN